MKSYLHQEGFCEEPFPIQKLPSLLEAGGNTLGKFRNFVKHQVLTPSEESALVAALERDSASVLFDRHFYIFDLLARVEAAKFEWVNMVREPVSRLVSQFHYLRCRSPLQGWRNSH